MEHDDDQVYFHSDLPSDLVIGMNTVEESGLFRILDHSCGRVSLETVHLSIHEFAAAAFLCANPNSLVGKITQLFRTSPERSVAVFHFMTELTAEANGGFKFALNLSIFKIIIAIHRSSHFD